MVQKILGKSDISKKKKKKHVWLSGRLHIIEGRLNEEPRLQRKKHKDKKNKAKQNKTNVTPEKDVMTSANQTPGGHKFAPLVASQQGRANQHEPACFGLSLALPITFGHTTACRSPALVFSATIHFATKCPAPCTAVLRHSPSSWAAAVVQWSAEVVQETPHPLFFLAPHTARAPHHLSEHHALRQSRILHARHKSRKQDPPPA